MLLFKCFYCTRHENTSKSDNVYSFFSMCKTKGHIGAPHSAQAWRQLHLVHTSCTTIGSTNISWHNADVHAHV